MLPTRVHADRAGLQAAQADAAGAGLRQGVPAQRARGGLRRRPTRRDRPDARGVGRAQHRRTAQGAALALPRDRPADRRVRQEIRHANPRGVVAVYIPEYVVGRWWEQLLHNQTALRLKGRLLFTPGVMVTSVPYQLRSSDRPRAAGGEHTRIRSGDLRRGRRRRAPATRTARSRGDQACPGGRPTAPAAAARGSGSGSTSRSVRSPTAVTASPGSATSPRPGRVVFVRHALPGETVDVEVTEGTEGDRFWRADAVEVLGRLARPGRRRRARTPDPDACGGCDFQHVALPAPARAQGGRGPRAAVPAGRLDVAVEVEAVPGDRGGLRWRTRQRYVELPDGRRGMRKHRSHEVVPVDECLLEAGRRAVVRGRDGGRALRGRRGTASGRCTRARPRCWSTRCSTCSRRSPGESVLDLYAGVGLFAALSPTRSGPARGGRGRGRPRRRASTRGATSATRSRWRRGPVDRVLASSYDEPFDLVVLDPPREGARRDGRRAGRRPGARARWPTSPATRPRSPATSRSSPSTATGSRRCGPSTCSR